MSTYLKQPNSIEHFSFGSISHSISRSISRAAAVVRAEPVIEGFTVTSSWQPHPGRLRSIHVSSNGKHVIGCNKNQGIYYKPGWNSSVGWRQLSGGLRIAAITDNSQIWGINSNQEIFYSPDTGGNWTKIPGKLVNIHVSSNGKHVIGVNSGQTIYYKSGNSVLGDWKNIPGAMVNVSIANDGQIWGVNRDGNIYHKPSWNTGAWRSVAGNLIHINTSGNGKHIVGTNKNHDIFYKFYDNGAFDNKWLDMSGKLNLVSITNNREMVGVNSRDSIFHSKLTKVLPPPPPPPPLMRSPPPPRPPNKKTLSTKKTKKAPFKKNTSQVSDLLLDTNVIDPYNLETILNKQKIDDITTLLQTLIKGNNYLLYDINNNKRDIYNELNNHNKKLYQEITKTFKKNTTSGNIYDIQMRQKVSNILTVFLEKVLKKTNIQNTRIQNARGKETTKLENKKQLLERQTKYDIQDIHIKNTVLKYIRLILYILIAILIVFCVINYIKT